MIGRACVICRWYCPDCDFCVVHKRTVEPNFACDCFYENSQDFPEDFQRMSHGKKTPTIEILSEHIRDLFPIVETQNLFKYS